MKKLLAAASVLILIGAGCAASPAPAPEAETPEALAPEAKAPAAPAAAPKTDGPAAAKPGTKNLVLKTTVIYGNDGKFVPQSTGVDVGGTITWKNESAQNFWPASDPHPTHTGYPGFDAGKPIKPGESWSFKFDKPGTFPYHNHFTTSQQGIVNIGR